jgi:phosphate-selective porin OprO/OprP
MSQLTVDSNAFTGTAATQLANPNTQASKATDYGIGIGWDLSREVRIMLDYDQTSFTGGAPNGGDRPDEKVLITRFQYSL